VLGIPVVSMITAFFYISFSLTARTETYSLNVANKHLTIVAPQPQSSWVFFPQHSLLAGIKCYSHSPGVMESQVHQSKLIIIRNMLRTTLYEAHETRITLHLANVIYKYQGAYSGNATCTVQCKGRVNFIFYGSLLSIS
jgi:hypothetical protein